MSLTVEIKTMFVDIDGTIFNHLGNLSNILTVNPYVLDDAKEKFNEWKRKNYAIILMTARPESMRSHTHKQLENLGLFYDQLVMGLPNGPRVLINDTKPRHPDMVTAKAYCVDRNKGLGDVNE